MDELLQKIRSCQICTDLPLGPRPTVQASPESRLLIIGQAPGTKVHKSGIPWDDNSGDRLRDWLQMDKSVFYDPARITMMPMGFCYPGKLEKGGDKPPRPECAPAWHDLLRKELKNIHLTLLVGSYAQNHYLFETKKKTMTETVHHFETYLEKGFFPLPHPSWRVTGFIKKNPWFETDLLPALRQKIRSVLKEVS